MENASKALLIAGGVLVAILVVSLGVYFSQNLAGSTSRIYSQLEDNQRTEFNQQFLNYNGNNNLTIQDVVTIINLAKDSNKKNEFYDDSGNDVYYNSFDYKNDKSLYVQVSFSGGGALGDITESEKLKNLQILSDSEINDLLSSEMTGSLKYFVCETIWTNENTGYVNYVKIGT